MKPGPARLRIPADAARRVALCAQGLDGRWRLPAGKAGAADAIERLGYVQIDTIAVVQRAHEHVLWSRCPRYAPAMLHELQATDRAVFEYWTHAASFVPLSDYRYYRRRMEAYRTSPRARCWDRANRRIVRHVLDRIGAEGPLPSAAFESPPGRRGPWWDWKPAKRALEHLFSAGRLMVSQRRNFQRVYDLTERVLPAGMDTSPPDAAEAMRFAVRRSLATTGVASIRDIHWGRRNLTGGPEAVQELVDMGEVVPLEVVGWDDDTHYALAEAVAGALATPRPRRRAHILSPFDNLIIRRRHVAKLFGFDYALECYLPQARRRYGYFCLAVLWGDRFVGRLDAKADREQGVLIVRKLVFESGFREHEKLLPDLARKIRAFARFNACNGVKVQETRPGRVRAAVRKAIA